MSVGLQGGAIILTSMASLSWQVNDIWHVIRLKSLPVD